MEWKCIIDELVSKDDNPSKIDNNQSVGKNALIFTCDETQITVIRKLVRNLKTFLAIMMYTTFSFVWKASAFMYQSIGMCVTSYVREFSVCESLYFDVYVNLYISICF